MIAFAEASESSDSDSPKERDGKISFSSEHPFMAVVEVPSRSTYRDDMDEVWNAYARTGNATHIILQKERTEDSGQEKVIVGSEETFHGQRVENIAGSAGKSAEPQECGQGGRKACLHGFY